MSRGVRSPEIWHRDDFALLCNWRKLWRAVEVGVDRAEYAQTFLSRWQGHAFLGVDNYEPYHEMPWDRSADFAVAAQRIERFSRIAKLARGRSLDVARALLESRREIYEGKLLQFIYIDGCHEYGDVKNDLAAWWPLLEPEGIIAGHDYVPEFPGVVEAVDQFAEQHALTVYLTDDRPRSWYAYKSGMPGPGWVRNGG